MTVPTGRPYPITYGEAAARRLVRLPDGRVGRVVWVGRRGGKAKVLVGGRHERHDPADLVVLAPEEEAS